MFEGDQVSPKEDSREVDFYKLLPKLHFFSLGHGVVRIKMTKQRNCLTMVNF